MWNNITWKKIMWIWIILTCSALFIIYAILNRDPSKVLLNHLEDKYHKEFVIAYSGERSDGISSWYEAEIYPKEFIGTIKENDIYYWAKGFVEAGEPGDTYGQVLLKESANKFYLPKLEELFGKNVLPVIEINDKFCKFTDFEKELEDLKKINAPMPISGGIYIFGRVENDEDREWYRKQIYEFVQFMKQTGTFEYVWLWVVVADERVLSDEFVNNTEDKEKLLSLHNGNETEFRKQRAEIMKKYNKSYEETPIENIRERTEKILKSDLYNPNGNSVGITKLTYYNHVLVSLLASEKYIKSNSLEEEYPLKDYDKIEDVEFYEEHY